MVFTYLTIHSITAMHPLRNWALKSHEYLSDGVEPTEGEVIAQIKLVKLHLIRIIFSQAVPRSYKYSHIPLAHPKPLTITQQFIVYRRIWECVADFKLILTRKGNLSGKNDSNQTSLR